MPITSGVAMGPISTYGLGSVKGPGFLAMSAPFRRIFCFDQHVIRLSCQIFSKVAIWSVSFPSALLAGIFFLFFAYLQLFEATNLINLANK